MTNGISGLFERLRQSRELGLAKAICRRVEVVEDGDDIIREDEEYWYVPCSHSFNAPATQEQLERVEEKTGILIPEQLRQFLSRSNGAKLFGRLRSSALYPVLDTEQIIVYHEEQWDSFLGNLGDDPDFRHVARLNYLSFCDAWDGNYLAVITEGPRLGQVFFLDHELLWRPFSEHEFDLEFYPVVAPSFAAWLTLLLDTAGWWGFGRNPASMRIL